LDWRIKVGFVVKPEIRSSLEYFFIWTKSAESA